MMFSTPPAVYLLDAPRLDNEKCLKARIYNGEKTVSSISGAGKTGQLHVKE